MFASKGNYINGKWLSDSSHKLISTNPGNGEIVWKGLEATHETVESAIVSARQAFKEWSSKPVNERTTIMQAMANELKADTQRLTEAISMETGKPLREAKEEVDTMIGKIAISIDAQHNRASDHIQDHPNALSITRHNPHGVVVILGPFNFPGHLPHGQIVPALLAGNTVVFKPSELTPYVGEVMADLWDKAGLPEGVLNLVQGGRNVGKQLAEHPSIDGLFFTGSWKTGQWLAEHFAKTPGKILALEMGGNNPLIVTSFDDVNAAVFLTIQSAYLSSGQRCTCARRLIVLKGEQGDIFIETLKSTASKLKIGAYNDSPPPYMGPVINEHKALELLKVQENLRNRGAKILLEMQHLKPNSGLISPGLIDVTTVRNREDEEFFGPLLQVIRVHDFDSALQEANNTSYGLSAGLISVNREEYDQFFNSIKAGVVNWNMPTTGASSKAPFGGIGKSGNHRPGAYYATDFCSYPIASLERTEAFLPSSLPPGYPEL
jgi:succinylglutamic semialdehyde dehydrogenase